MSPLTPKQKKILDYISNHLKTNGFAPSQAEIARGFGFSSLGTVQNYLRRLEAQGLLSREWNARRSARVLAPVAAEPVPSGAHLPLAGTVAAGRPLEAVEVPDTLEVPGSMAGDRNFVLKVKGDSMTGDGILDGDFVVVRRQPHAENGQTVVALLGNEATVKRFYRRGATVELRPANPALVSILVREGEPFRIEGVVVGVIRHLA